jgi:two-component system cell cycle response regulator
LMTGPTQPEPRGDILLAEDSSVVRAMVRQVLETAGYRVAEAENGEVAFAMIHRHRPDVALLNVEMPVLDGHQLLTRMKADPTIADIPVIFLTGRTSTAEIVEGLRMGAHDYLRKPFEPAELIARVSAAIRIARLQQELTRQNFELEHLSRTDQLTGLANRRHGDERLREEFAVARRHRRDLSALMLDVDHFKSINDRYGHAGGDDVLQEIARRLESALRPGDVAARWGGEEFLVILPNTALEQATSVADRILVVMKEHPVSLTDEQQCNVTISIGAATSFEHSPDDLVRQADDALYRAKRGGRDRVCVAQR